MPVGPTSFDFFLGPASFFSFDTAGGASSLNFETTNMSGNLCVGAPAALGSTGCGSGGVNGALVEPEFLTRVPFFHDLRPSGGDARVERHHRT